MRRRRDRSSWSGCSRGHANPGPSWAGAGRSSDQVGRRPVLAAAGIPVTAVREVVARRLDQETPGQLGAITRAIAEAGIRVDVLYSDHDHRLILVTSDQAATAIATKAWDR